MFDILVAEDDFKLNRIYCSALQDADFHTFAAYNGEEALKIVEEHPVDLVISDIMMPGMDGYTLTKQLREAHPALPILMISAKEEYADKRDGFLAGIDDYMVKPVDLNEMLLRVQALLRRAQIVTERKLTVGNTVLLYDSYAAEFDGKTVEIPQKEFLVLYKLMSYPNRTFTRRQLMDELLIHRLLIDRLLIPRISLPRHRADSAIVIHCASCSAIRAERGIIRQLCVTSLTSFHNSPSFYKSF